MPEFVIIPGTNPETFISFWDSQALLTMVKNYMWIVLAAAPAQWEPKVSWGKGAAWPSTAADHVCTHSLGLLQEGKQSPSKVGREFNVL